MRPSNNLNYDIIFPFFKDYEYLEKSLNYINLQNLLPNNLIFIDDGNKNPNLLTLIKKNLSNKINLIFISFDNNKGNITGVLEGVKRVKASYFFIMAADDIYYPDLSIKSLTLLSQNKNTGFVCSNIISNYKDKNFKKSIKYSFLNKIHYKPEEAKKILKFQMIKFYHNTVFYRTAYFKKINYFNKIIGPRCDFYNLIFFSSKFGFSYLDEYLAEFTIRKDQINKRYKDKYLIEEMKIIKKNFRELFYLVKELDMFFDLSPFGVFKLKNADLGEIVSYNLIKKSIFFYLWKKLRVYMPDSIIQFVYKIIN